MDLRRRLQNYIALNNYVEAFRSNVLPDEYTQLEYIESSGTQYIDTGLKGNGTTKVHINARYYTTTSAGGSGRIFGSRDAAAVNAFAVGSASGTASTNSTVAFFFGNQSYLVTDKPIILDEWLDIVFDKTTHNINGVDYGDPYNDETFETPQTLKIFGFDNSGTMGVGYVDIAYCQLWNNNILVRNFIPAKRNSDNVIGMYDTVSDRFFTNQGTGNFIAGPNVSKTPYSNKVYLEDSIKDSLSSLNVYGKTIQSKVPEGYTELEYLQSNGTAYIDLDCILDQNDEIEIDFMKTSNVTSCNVFGGRDSASSNNMSVIIASSGSVAADFNNSDYAPYRVIATISQNVMYKVIVNKTGRYVYDANGTLVDSNTTACADTISTPGCYLFHLAGAGLAGKFTGIIYKCVVKGKRDCVPAKRNSDNVLGMYDKVSGQFFTNEGTGAFVAGPEVVPTPDNPIDIYCSNGKITISPNKANYIPDNVILGYWIRNNNGQPESSPANFYTNMMPVKPNTNYICYGRRKDNSAISGYNRFAWYDATGTWIRNSTYTQGTIGSDVSPSNAAYVRFHCNIDGSNVTQELIDSYNWTVREGTIEEPFIPFGIITDGTPEKLNIKGNNLYDITKDITGKFIGEDGSIGNEPYSCYSDLIPVKSGESYTYSGICNVGSASTANNKRIHGYVNGVWNRQIAVISVNKNTPFYTTFTIPAGINGIRISHWTDDSNTQVEECYRPTKYNNYIDMNLDVANLLSIGDYIDVQDILNSSIIRNVGIKVLDGTEEIWGSVSQTPDYVSVLTNCYTVAIPLGDAPIDKRRVYCTHLNSSDTLPDAGSRQGFALLGNGGSATPEPLLNKYAIGLGLTTRFPTIAGLKQWLADQYNAGTPVIIIYPLKNTTTETVTSQTTLLSSNNNVIIRDSKYMDNLGLDLTYKKLR
jgi:hypothetical protein